MGLQTGVTILLCDCTETECDTYIMYLGTEAPADAVNSLLAEAVLGGWRPGDKDGVEWLCPKHAGD